MYFADLSPCRYYGLSVGWLEKGHDFPRGAVPRRFLERLLERCRNPEIRHRGFHVCEFCQTRENAQAARVRELLDGERILFGSGIIRVHPRQGVSFVAPTLIYHYVQAHGYLPPQAFIEAMMEDNPENAETAAARYRHGAQYLSRMALGWLWARGMQKSEPQTMQSRNPECRGREHDEPD